MPTLITRQDALGLGLTRFYTGRPCVHGHDSERLTSSNGCIRCMNLNKQARSKTRAFKDQRNARLIAQREERRELRPCIICQTPFDYMIDGRLGAKTCSKECGDALRDKRAAEQRKPPDSECAWCFGMFVSHQRNRTTCSVECREAITTEKRAARVRQCRRCKSEYRLGASDHGRNGFCSDDCRRKQSAANTARAAKKFRLLSPEKMRERKKRYKIVNAEAHQRTTKKINDRRVAHETAALAAAKELIPDMLATVRGYRKKVNMAIEFMRSLDINVPKHATEPTP